MTKQFRITAAAVLLASFFIPWFSFYGIGASPYTLASRSFGEGWVFALIPILAGIVIYVELKEIKAKIWLLIAGLSPFVISIWVLSQFGLFSPGRSSSFIRFSFSDVVELADFGVFLAIAAGAVLIVAFFQRK